jgi:hypothetical protein
VFRALPPSLGHRNYSRDQHSTANVQDCGCIRELYRENAYEWKYFLNIDLSASGFYSIGWNPVSGPFVRTVRRVSSGCL